MTWRVFFTLTIFFFSYKANSLDNSDILFYEGWQRHTNFACLDDPKYRANRKFNRLFTLIKSLEVAPPGRDTECEEERLELVNIPEATKDPSIQSRLAFAKELSIQSRMNAAKQMAYFYYRIFDPSKKNTPEHVSLDRISIKALHTVYEGYDRETRTRIIDEVNKFVEMLQDNGIKRLTPEDHARIMNSKVEVWNETLGQTTTNKGQLVYEVFPKFKKQFYQDLATDTGLLFLTDALRNRVGSELLVKDSIHCLSTPRSFQTSTDRNSGICRYPKRKARVRSKDIEKSINELKVRFWHERSDAQIPMDLARKFKISPKEDHRKLAQELNEYIADMLVYSPRTYNQVIAKSPKYLEHICASFDYAFEREGSQYINTKIKNGIEFFGPASMWIIASGIMPFTNKNRPTLGYKKAIKGIMGITAMDLIWRGKNVLYLGNEVDKHEDQIIGGNADVFSFQEYERLQQQFSDDRKGLVLVATYETLSLIAIGRLAKIVSTGKVKKFLTNKKQVDELFMIAQLNKVVQKQLAQKGIKSRKDFLSYLKKTPQKERVKFVDSLAETTFGASTFLTAGITAKELGDTVYFMNFFPYIPQGIAATND